MAALNKRHIDRYASLNGGDTFCGNASLGKFVVVRTSYSVLTQLLLLGYKPVQHVTVPNEPAKPQVSNKVVVNKKSHYGCDELGAFAAGIRRVCEY